MAASRRIYRYLADDHVRIDDALRRASSQPETIEPNAYAEFRVRLRKHIGLEEKVTISPCESRYRVGITLPCACADTLGKFTLLERAAKIIRTKYAYDQEAIKLKEAGAPVDYVFPLT